MTKSNQGFLREDTWCPPVIFEQGGTITNQQTGCKETINCLSQPKTSLNNLDIPYIDKNHPVYTLCEVADSFVITGHAKGYITMWETVNCEKRVINQYLPSIDLKLLNLNWATNNGDIGLANG